MEGSYKRSAPIAALARAGALVAVFLLVSVLAGVGPGPADATIPEGTSTPPGIILAQTGFSPDSTLDEEDEEDWEEEEGDTLSVPPGLTPPAGTSTMAPSDSLRPSPGAPGTTGAAADSTPGAILLPSAPARGDTIRYDPNAPKQTPGPARTPAVGAAAPKERSGFLGLHPAAIAFGLIVAHYFIVKAATD